jgi:anti-anti-sigma factor
MVTAQTTSGWRMDVDRGPDWMFVRLHPSEELGLGDLSLAENIWSLLQQSFVYRLVLELDELQVLQSCVIAQLVMLAKRIHSHNGMLRLSGLSQANQEVIHICRLDECLPNFCSRGDAVMGHRPVHPR